MAQTTRSTSKSPKSRGNGTRAKSGSSSKSAASKSAATRASRSKRSSSNGKRTKPKSTAGKRTTTKRVRQASRSTARSRTGAESVTTTALDKTKAAGHAVAEAASKAKTPLIAGGTALAGAAAGAVLRDRLATKRSKNPLKRLRGVSMPRPASKMDLGKLDLNTVKSMADRVSAYGQRASDIAAAVEQTRNKRK